MRFRIFKRAVASMLAGLLAAVPSTGTAGSLAGSVGDKRFPVYLAPGSTGGCGKHYREYVAAGGHSAYAMTPFNWATEFTICGVSLNASSQQAAEAKAMKSCESGRKRWKVSTAGTCGIAASK